MSSRANYVIVEQGTTRYFAKEANRIDEFFFWGPEHALATVREQSELDSDDNWLDEVWCEGAALIDLDRRVLLFFGAEGMQYDPLRHRLTLALMRRTWTDWDVRWAFEGLGDLVDCLGLSRELVRSGRPVELKDVMRVGQRSDGFCTGVFTIEHSDGRITIHGSYGMSAPSLFNFPSELVDRLATISVAHEVVLPSAPISGAHLDLPRRHIDLWHAGHAQDLQTRVRSGWTLRHHGAEFEVQLALAKSMLTFVPPSQKSMLAELATTFVVRWARPSVEERARLFEEAAAGLPRLPGFES